MYANENICNVIYCAGICPEWQRKTRDKSGRVIVVPADILTGHLPNKSHISRASLLNQNVLQFFFLYKPKGKSDNTKDEMHKLIW